MTPRPPAVLRALAFLLAVLSTACSGTPVPASGSRDAERDTASPMQVADPELVLACDSLQRWTAALTGQPQRQDGQLTVGNARLPRWGCSITAADTLAPAARRPLDSLRSTLVARGWSPEQNYAAESSDGGMVGVRRGTLLCVLQHFWQAHSDDERAAEQTEHYRYDLQIECFREAARSAP